MGTSKKVDRVNLFDLFIISVVSLSCLAILIVIARGIEPDIDLTFLDFIFLFLSTGVLAFLSLKGTAKKSFDKLEKKLDPDGVL